MTLVPTSVATLIEAVRAHPHISVHGAGSKRPVNDSTPALVSTGLSGIIDYVPDECVMTAWAGTPVATMAARLREHGQYLPFDPPWIEAGATLGGTVAAAASGSGRHRYGGVRDFMIGAAIVDGEGRLIRSGGKVVKNAAGFLLHHAMVGSFGHYGVLAEVTLKVFPIPERRVTLEVPCTDWLDGVQMMTRLQGLRVDLEAVDWHDDTIWLRLAGRAAAIESRLVRLRTAVARPSVVHGGDADAMAWHDVREMRWSPPDTPIVKVPTSLSQLAAMNQRPVWLQGARIIGAGAAAWVPWPHPLDALDVTLTAAGARAVVLRGRESGRRLGAKSDHLFESRLAAALDPRGRFRAASHSH